MSSGRPGPVAAMAIIRACTGIRRTTVAVTPDRRRLRLGATISGASGIGPRPVFAWVGPILDQPARREQGRSGLVGLGLGRFRFGLGQAGGDGVVPPPSSVR